MKKSAVLLSSLFLSAFSVADEISHDHMAMQGMHHQMMGEKDHAPIMSGANRIEVVYPREVYENTLGNMREHLRSLNQMSSLVAKGEYEKAADVIERGLGYAHRHGTAGQAVEQQYMPQQMMQLGQQMHQLSGDLVLALRDMEITGDYPAVFAAIGKVTENCVACHDSFRLVAED